VRVDYLNAFPAQPRATDAHTINELYDSINLGDLWTIKTKPRSMLYLHVPILSQTKKWEGYKITLLHTSMLLAGRAQSVELIATGWTTEGSEFRVSVGSRIFTSPCRPERLWGPPSLLSNGYRGLFSLG
jgi:hypothetical protein